MAAFLITLRLASFSARVAAADRGVASWAAKKGSRRGSPAEEEVLVARWEGLVAR